MWKSAKGLVDRYQTPIAGKVALAGLASVLLFLSGFSIWATRTTHAAAEEARISKKLSDLYESARFSVAEERSLEREYRLNPFRGTRELFEQKSASFIEAMDAVTDIGDGTDLALAQRMSLQHESYLGAIDRLFDAVDAGRMKLVERIDEEEIDPVFSDIEERIYTASFQHATEAEEAFRSMEQTETQVRYGTLAAFAAGLALLATLIFANHQRRLQEGEERFRSMVRSSSDVIMIIGANGTIVYQSRPLTVGAEGRDVLGSKFLDLVTPEDRSQVGEFLASLEQATREISVEIRMGDPDNSSHCEIIGNNLMGNPNVAGIVLTIRDITERKHAEETHRHLEAQLRQSQKMEAIGQLAGGVAHDFNNLISVILNYTRFSIEGLPEDDQRRVDMEEVICAGEQAANLTRQLLAFSRKEVAQPTEFVLNDVVVEVENMLRRSLGEQIEFQTVLDPGLFYVRVDRTQVQQIIMNLCVNARDAMTEGGLLLLETSNERVDGSHPLGDAGLPPGDFVCLSVTDTGVGMTEDVKGRMFEPFFTTKEQGLGTGLGLSTVYGIAAQAGGHVIVESQLGAGTTFKVYLPRVAVSDPTPVAEVRASGRHGSNETILVVEDEVSVRELVRRMLSRHGFDVMVAPSAKEALSILESAPRKIDVLLTDVVMPSLSGKELATLAKESAPDLRVVFMSGYTNNIVAQHGVLDSDEILLQKPFTEKELIAKLNDVIAQPVASLR